MVNVFLTEIFAEFAAYFNIQKAVTLSLPLVLLTLGLILVYYFYLRGKTHVTIHSYSRGRKVFQLTRFQKAVGLVFTATILSFSTFIPLLILLIQSKFRFITAVKLAYSSLFNSIWMSAVGATLMVAVGFFLAYKQRRFHDFIILLPIAVPSAVLGIGLIKLFNTSYTNIIYASPLIIIIGYCGRFLPYITKSLNPFFQQIYPGVEESARLSGASFTKFLSKILYPLMKPGIVFAWILGFMLSLRELGVTLLVSPAGVQALSNRIYILIHYGAPDIVASLCLILVFLIVSPILLLLSLKQVSTWVSSKL
jgi:iron(III) transport system permease protein